MKASGSKMIRVQSVATFLSLAGLYFGLFAASRSAGTVFIGGVTVLLMLSTYIFATRTFRLTRSRHMLFFGAGVPGLIVIKVFEILTVPEFGLLRDYTDLLMVQFHFGSRLFLVVLLLLTPWASRLKVHRYVWTAASIAIGSAAVALAAFTDLVPRSIFVGPGDSFGSVYLNIAVCTGLLLVLSSVLTVGIRLKKRKVDPQDHNKLRLVVGALFMFLAAAGFTIFRTGRYGWAAQADAIFSTAAWFLIMEILVYQGLELPIRLISRSRSQLDAAIAAAVDGLLVNDLDGRVIAMNARFRIAAGVGQENGGGVESLLARVTRNALNREHLKNRIRELLARPDSEGFERFETTDGRVMEMSTIPYLYQSRIDGRVWTFRDVSVRERTTAQLERSNWRLDNILSSVREGIFELNLDTGSVWCHDNWCSVVGCEPGQTPISQEMWRQMIHADDVPLFMREMRKPSSGSRDYRMEIRMTDGAGGWRWFMVAGSVGRVEADGDWIMNGVLRDITSDRARESEIRRQRSLMEALIENMPLGAFVKQMPSRKYVIWNSAIARLSGLIPKQVIGKTDLELFGQIGAVRAGRADDDVVSQGVPVVLENSLIGESSGRNVRVRLVPVLDADRTVTLIIGIVEDVTQQQQIERLVHQSRSMEALGRLAGGVAHDFNNILQVIIGSADALKISGSCDADGREDLDQILQAGERAMALVSQLLSFSRQDSSAREPIDIGRLVAELMKMLQRLIGADITVKLMAPEGRLFVFAEKTRLEQVVMNLTVNAVDAMPYGGVLEIEAGSTEISPGGISGNPRAAPGRYVTLFVRDSGIGIPGDVLDHVWEPFFSTKDVGKGVGLGLSTVYGIVESLGGFVSVKSETGRGTEFQVFLPGHGPVVSDVADGNDAESGGSRAEPTGRVPTVVVGGQDRDAVNSDSIILENAGFRVIRSYSGPEVMQRLLDADRHGGVDLIMLDLVMSGMGACEICDRYHSDHPDTPVIFTAGPSAPIVDSEYLKKIGGTILVSPYTGRQLILAVRTVLEKRP